MKGRHGAQLLAVLLTTGCGARHVESSPPPPSAADSPEERDLGIAALGRPPRVMATMPPDLLAPAPPPPPPSEPVFETPPVVGAMPPLATAAPPPPADPVAPPRAPQCRGTIDSRGRCGPAAAASVERAVEMAYVSLGPLRLQWADRVSIEASVSPSAPSAFRIPMERHLVFTLAAPNGDVRILTDAVLHSERTRNPERPFSGIRWQIRPDGTGARQLALRVDALGSGPPERLGEHIFTLDVASPPAVAAQPPGQQAAQPPPDGEPALPGFAQTLWDWVRGPIGIISALLLAITAFSTKLRDMFKSLRETREEFAKLKGGVAGEPGGPAG